MASMHPFPASLRSKETDMLDNVEGREIPKFFQKDKKYKFLAKKGTLRSKYEDRRLPSENLCSIDLLC